MVKKVIFVAEDGTEFYTEKECLAYEWKASHLPDTVTFYNEAGWPMFPTTADECDKAYNAAKYVEILELKSSSLKEDLEWIWGYFGYCVPTKPGFYEICEDHFGWDRLADKWHPNLI